MERPREGRGGERSELEGKSKVKGKKTRTRQGCDMIDKMISIGLDRPRSRSRAHDRAQLQLLQRQCSVA